MPQELALLWSYASFARKKYLAIGQHQLEDDFICGSVITRTDTEFEARSQAYEYGMNQAEKTFPKENGWNPDSYRVKVTPFNRRLCTLNEFPTEIVEDVKTKTEVWWNQTKPELQKFSAWKLDNFRLDLTLGKFSQDNQDLLTSPELAEDPQAIGLVVVKTLAELILREESATPCAEAIGTK